MKWNPTAAADSICGAKGWQELCRPAEKPGVEMAGSAAGMLSDPRVEMAGFENESAAEPAVEMAGFERASRRYFPTVSRLRFSSRAIRRADQPCPAKVKIECCRLTLS